MPIKAKYLFSVSKESLLDIHKSLSTRNKLNSFIPLVLSTDKAGRARGNNNMEIITKELARSRMYWTLWERRIMRKLTPFVALALIIWTAWIWQLTNAYPELVNPIIITLN